MPLGVFRSRALCSFEGICRLSDDLAFVTATRLVDLYRDKRVSPVEVTIAVLERIEAANDAINAFSLIDTELALAAARASEARWMRGEPSGLIDGVLVSIKEFFLVDGWPTLRGSRTVDPHQPWCEDAPAVARLREHGAVLIGQTTSPEFGWKGVTDSPLRGVTRNPWNPLLTPGGSSGGAAAALACGLGQRALGSDGGGSIRIPASFCGVFGLKPTFGRVAVYPSSAFGTLTHAGPMARSVGDAALMLTVIAQPEWRDGHALRYQKYSYYARLERSMKGLRIAYSPTLGYARVDAEVAELIDGAARTCEDLGAEVERIDCTFEDPASAFGILWAAGAANLVRDLAREQVKLMDHGLARLVEIGRGISLMTYLSALARCEDVGRALAAMHERFDLLITPTVAVPPFAVGRLKPEGDDCEHWFGSWTPFTYPFNMSRQPAASVPCGFTKSGLPVGVQIVGAMYEDALVLSACHVLEMAHSVVEARPSLSRA